MQVVYHKYYRADKKICDGPPLGYDPRTIEVVRYPETGEEICQLTYRQIFRELGALYQYTGPSGRFQFSMHGEPGYRRLKRSNPNLDSREYREMGEDLRLSDCVIEEFPWGEFPWAEDHYDFGFFAHFMELVYWEYMGRPAPWGDYEVSHATPFALRKMTGFSLFTYDKTGFHTHEHG